MDDVSLQTESVMRAPPSARSASDVAAVAPSSSVAPRPARCVMRGIEKSYGALPILRGVDLDIPEGAFAVLVGPSGCGKSTLLRVVAGLETADRGTVEIAKRDVTRLPPRDRDVAMVFQSYALYPHLTVRENLAFGLKLRGVAASEIAKRIAEASTMLGLDALLNRLPKEMSGGQRQRVAMGRAIVRHANLYLFDEPLSNLDAALRAEVRVEIRRLHDRLDATTLYVTHDQVEAMTLADTLWVMNGGVVEQRGAPLDVYERPRSRFVATFLGSPQMNVVEGSIVRRDGVWLADGGGIVTRVDEERFGGALVAGRAVSIGVRPHDFEVADAAKAAATLRIEIVEALGFEAFAHGWLRSSGPKIVARLEAHHARRAKAGEALPLTVDPKRVHLFDPATGLALDALPQSPTSRV